MELTAVEFASSANRIHENGYLILPIRRLAKNPSIPNWTEYRFDPVTDADKYRRCGIGIITGRQVDGRSPLAAIDIDITDVRYASLISDTIEAMVGEAPCRVGKAPKRLLLYRADAPNWRKRASSRYDVGRIEVLGAGQQFVAYGIHPDTQQPYTWGAGLDPVSVRADALPVLTQQDVTAVIDMFEHMMQRDGHQVLRRAPTAAHPDDASDDIDVFDALVPAIGEPLERMRKRLQYIDVDDREIWINAGMAMHHEYAGDAAALAEWDDWSRASTKYKSGECEYLWARFASADPDRRPVTAKWLIKYSNDRKRQLAADKRVAALNMLLIDIENCTDTHRLTNDVAKAIAEAELDHGAMAVAEKKFRAQFQSLTAGATLTKREMDKIIDAHLTVPGRELTEVGNSLRLADRHGKNMLYLPETDTWFRWDGSRWLPATREHILRMADSTVSAIKAEAADASSDKQRKKISGWHLASQSANMLDNMVKLVRKHPGIMISPRDLDADMRYIGVQNGAVFLETGDLVAPRREQRLTLNTDTVYDPEAEATLFRQTVADAFFGDEEMAAFLQRLVGYALLGQPEKEEILVIPEGRGANGKSTIFNAIHRALGAYSKYSAADTFINARSGSGSSGSGAREDVLRLAGARFVYVTELEENGVLRESFVKGMTGGEAIPARGLYSRHTIEVTPTWVAFMPTNHLPIIKGEDKGIWRKIIVLPFNRDFTADRTIEKDVNRKSKLIQEEPGILRWAVQGALEYQRIGLARPDAIARASAAYRAEMDVLSDWLESCCDIGQPDYIASNAELWASWENYARVEGKSRLVPSSNSLSRRLVNRGLERVKNIPGLRGRGFRGVRIRQEDF